jgi:PTS system ascorbate-specific IIA component
VLKNWIYDTTITLQDSVRLAAGAGTVRETAAGSAGDCAGIRDGNQAAPYIGPYYVLAPGLAMPHARPEEGPKGWGCHY